ncbi:MAG: nucleotide exchange factor GrpE [Parcubacteria group bacterium]|nr:nucleotide exchange factor GrpE [Parcubacteria group bacterium]
MATSSADEEEVFEEGRDIEVAPEVIEESDLIDDEVDEAGAAAKVVTLKEEVGALRKEKQEYMDGWQRAKADYVNVLKRFEGENKSAKQAGLLKAVETLLPAFDALERSKEHGQIPEGFVAIAKQLESAFISLGLVEVGKAGEPFDPSHHEAFGQDATQSADEDGKVTVVLEKGWRIGETVIRPAKVRIAAFDKQ